MNRRLGIWDNHTYRTCDALVLAYSPENVLGKISGRDFYIPSSEKIGAGFDYSLRQILVR